MDRRLAGGKPAFERIQDQPKSEEREKHPTGAHEVVSRAMMVRLEKSFSENVENHDDAVESRDEEFQPSPVLDEPEGQTGHEYERRRDQLPVFNDWTPDEVRKRTDRREAECDKQLMPVEHTRHRAAGDCFFTNVRAAELMQ